MSAVATAWAKAVAQNNPELSAADKRTLLCLARHHTIKHGHAIRSFAAVASETMDCIRTVKSSVSRLAGMGFIEKQAQRKSNRQGANRYLLNLGCFRVQKCTLKEPVSECSSQTPEVVHPVHPEKHLQSADLHHHTRTRARPKTEASVSRFAVVSGGRHG